MSKAAVQYSFGRGDMMELGQVGIEALGEPAVGRAHEVLWNRTEDGCGCDDCRTRIEGLQID